MRNHEILRNSSVTEYTKTFKDGTFKAVKAVRAKLTKI